jgi:hypothetical protein
MQRIRQTTRFALAATVLLFSPMAKAQWTIVSQINGGNSHIDLGNFTGISIFGSIAMVGETDHVNVFVEGAEGSWSSSSTLNSLSVPAVPAPGSFGVDVGVFADFAIVGAPTSVVGANSSQGAVYVFNRTAGSWTYAQTLTASDGAANDSFGKKVTFSMAGDYILVFAKGANGGNGAIYVFGIVGGLWTQLQKLTGIHGGGVKFGQGRAMSANRTILIGEPQSGSAQSPPGFVYVCPTSGSRWVCGTPMMSPGASSGDQFGTGVAFYDDNHFIVGAPGELGTGNAYMFTNTSGGWTGAALLPNMATLGSSLGLVVNAHSGWIVVGAPYTVIGGNPGQGAAYAYPFPPNNNPPQILADPLGVANENFGNRVKISGQTILVDSAYVSDQKPGATFFFAPATPVGSTVATNGPTGPTGAPSSVTFNTVSSAGGTNIVLDTRCPTLPSGLLQQSNEAGCISAVVSTTAAYAGGVSVCIPMPSPAPFGPVAVVQCDPNPGNQPCPLAGIDSRLTQASTDPFGNPLCCGSVSDTVTTSPGTDPICFTTSSLSLFAVGQSVPAAPAPVPALGRNGWLAFFALLALLAGLRGLGFLRTKRTPA